MLKFVLGLSASILATSAAFAGTSSTTKFMEDNDLWKEDRFEMDSNIDKAKFNEIVQLGRDAYEPIAKQNNETLVINARWDDSTVNANCSRSGRSVTVNMYGGLARRPEVTAEGFALVLCHELGHAYGGTPYVQPARKMAAEGQSDYYGAKVCLDKVLPSLGYDPAALKMTDYTKRVCAETFGEETPDAAHCLRALSGGQSLGELLATLKKEDAPNYETPDTTVVSRTETSYPATVQCRLDTYHNGALDMVRPACWYKDGK